MRSTDQGSAGSSAVAPTTRAPARRRVHRSGSQRSRGTMLGLNLLSLVLGLVLWAIVSANVANLPTPLEVLRRGVESFADGPALGDLVASLKRVFAGFILGTGLAILVGFAMGWYPVARGLLEPYVQFFRTIPPLAIIPLAIVLMGIGEQPKIFVIFLAAFLVSVISTFQGVVSVDKTLVNAARVLGADDGTIFARVVIPASTPFILVGMRTGLGSAWATLVASELIAAQEGLGFRMQQAQLYYDLPTIFVNLVIIGMLGLAMDRGLLWAEKKLTGWQERR